MTTQAYKFKNWIIPRGNRLDEFHVPFKKSTVNPFRLDGEISLYGRARRPLAAKVHTTSNVFMIKKSCRADLLIAKDTMMESLLDGAGRLWFSTPDLSAPLVFCENVSPDEISWVPSRADWSEAVVTIEWGIDNPTMYRPLSAGYLASQSFTPVSIADDVFGESGDERAFASFTISGSPTNITIENIGQMRTGRLILRLESLGVFGFVNPVVTNNTTDQFFAYAGSGATAASVLQINCAIGPARVRSSEDGGASFVDNPTAGNVWPDLSIGPLQGPIMELAPGTNSLTIEADGTPNFRLLVLWLPAYAML